MSVVLCAAWDCGALVVVDESVMLAGLPAHAECVDEEEEMAYGVSVGG